MTLRAMTLRAIALRSVAAFCCNPLAGATLSRWFASGLVRTGFFAICNVLTSAMLRSDKRPHNDHLNAEARRDNVLGDHVEARTKDAGLRGGKFAESVDCS